MRFYFYTTPPWLKRVYRSFTWTVKHAASNELYLTFDDGPVPDATEKVINMLETVDARGTFFVVGDNVRKYPEILRNVIAKGHQVGNHTFNHVKGWNTSLDEYIAQVNRCDKVINMTVGKTSGLFRPPYGRITFAQAKALSQTHEIVMWQVLSGDFDRGLNLATSLKALKRATGGDILVFHDSQKYIQNVEKLLPVVLDYFGEKGFCFKPINED